MSLTQLTNEVLALPLEDRVFLAERLWESVHRTEDKDADVDLDLEETLDEAERRADELDRGVVQPLTHEEVMASARKALECD